MKLQKFMQAGHWPTLLSAFLYFDVSFMVWVVLGPLSLYLTKDLGISLEEKFGLVAIPILFGALLRVPMGLLADHLGPKRAGQLGQLIILLALAYVWQIGLHSKQEVEIFGALLGFAGASFAVAIPQASRWYPPEYQGVVLGIAGAGNVGVVFDQLFIPSLAEHFGWQNVFGFLLIPLLLVFVIYTILAKDAPDKRAPVTLKNYATVLSDSDTWWFMLFYSITFGGFVGLGNALTLYFTSWYHASGVAAGVMVAIVVAAGSLFRPVGGYIADRIGGIKALQILFSLVALCYLIVGMMPEGPVPNLVQMGDSKVGGWSLFELPGIAWASVLVFFVGAVALGMGNGSVFQLVPLRFRREMGVMTGLVGAAGGVGGFFLAKVLGWSKGMTGSFGMGFWLFSALAVVGLVGLTLVKTRWRTTWGASSVTTARV